MQEIKNLRTIAELTETLSRWEITRTRRLDLERQFLYFTGHLDIVELHIPYTRYKYVDELIGESQQRKGKKVLVCAGDSLNLDMFSRFYRTSSDDSKPSVEWKTLVEVLREAESIYDKIIFMVTNHDNRIFKLIRNEILGKERAEEVLEWMLDYAQAFEREHFKKIITVAGAIFQIGDVIITHFENNSIVPGVVPRDVIKYLIPRIEKQWNIVFQAHTHSQSKISNDRKIGIETGALCRVLDYWRSGKMQGKGKLSSLGYAVCDLKNGVADKNSADFVFKEWEDFL